MLCHFFFELKYCFFDRVALARHDPFGVTYKDLTSAMGKSGPSKLRSDVRDEWATPVCVGKDTNPPHCKLQQIWLQDWASISPSPPPPPPGTMPLSTLPSSSSAAVACLRRPAYHLAYVKVSLFATSPLIAPLEADPI